MISWSIPTIVIGPPTIGPSLHYMSRLANFIKMSSHQLEMRAINLTSTSEMDD